MMPVNMLKTDPMIQNAGLDHGMDICLSATRLNDDSASCTRINENAKATVDTNNDSLKNWLMSCFRNEPNVLRIPTSLARFSERAVLRFMKLIQASSNTNVPMMPNIHTNSIFPPTITPFLNSEYRCHLLIG